MIFCKIAKVVWRATAPLGGFLYAQEGRPRVDAEAVASDENALTGDFDTIVDIIRRKEDEET